MKTVDIWWEEGGRLRASMRWTNKRGRISFYLIPAVFAECKLCPLENNPICGKHRNKVGSSLCSELWNMQGNNKFKGRNQIRGWQPVEPFKRGRKIKE